MTNTTSTTTLTTENSANLPSLLEAAQRMTNWRATRQKGDRIPDELWEQATALARVHGMKPTANALKLDYHYLLRRLTSGEWVLPAPATGPTFVEMPPPPIPREPSTPHSLELVQPSGARLTLRFADTGLRELLPLVQLFLEARP